MKRKRLIELYLGGKTIRNIVKEVHISFRDISKIIKEYRRKQIKRENTNNNNNATSTKNNQDVIKHMLYFLKEENQLRFQENI